VPSVVQGFNTERTEYLRDLSVEALEAGAEAAENLPLVAAHGRAELRLFWGTEDAESLLTRGEVCKKKLTAGLEGTPSAATPLLQQGLLRPRDGNLRQHGGAGRD